MITTAFVTCPQPNPHARLRLFCFPYGGGGASIFRTWQDDLLPEIEVCPIQLPGREDRLLEVSFTELSPLIKTLALEFSAYTEIPFAFFGHSMGGLIAFELTRELRKRNNVTPIHLFISAYRAPHLPNPITSIAVESDSAIIGEIRRFGGTPEWVLQDTELMQELLPTIKADIQVVKTYTYSDEAPLDCPISAFGGWQDELVTQDHLEEWNKHTNKAFTLQIFPGNHMFLHRMRSLLLQSITESLQEFWRCKI